MTSIFEDKAHKDIISRIHSLEENSQPHWGKMNVSQMLHHCQAPLNIMLQKKHYLRNFPLKIRSELLSCFSS